VGTAFLLAAVPLLYMYGDPVKPKSGGAVGGLLSLLRSREALRDSAAMAAWAFSVNVAAAVWNYHLYAAFGANESWFTTLNLIGGVVGTFASPPWGSFYDRYGPRATFLLSGLGIVLVPALFPLLPSLAGQSALQVYSTFLWTGFNLAAFNYAVAYTHERRHIYIAVYNLLPALASAAGAAVGAWLYNTGGVLAFYASALGRLAALAALYRVATPRGASYEELRVASYLYPLYSAGTQALHLALLELAMVARVAYAAAVVVGLLALILTFFTVLLSVLRF